MCHINIPIINKYRNSGMMNMKLLYIQLRKNSNFIYAYNEIKLKLMYFFKYIDTVDQKPGGHVMLQLKIGLMKWLAKRI